MVMVEVAISISVWGQSLELAWVLLVVGSHSPIAGVLAPWVRVLEC